MKKLIYLFALAVLVSGCVSVEKLTDKTIDKYKAEYLNVKLGDSKNTVLAILSPTQKELPRQYRKAPETFKKVNDTIEIYYFRSLKQPNSLSADDEFTPYIFTNDILTGIGWAAVRGMKSSN